MKKVSEIMDRREFILAGGLVGAGAVAAGAVIVKDRMAPTSKDPTGEKTVRHLNALKDLKPQPNEDDHIRMQRELAAAMSKPVEKRQWIMVIDTGNA